LTPQFDTHSAVYDQWYDSPAGQLLFKAEAGCLQQLGGTFSGRWVEIGVGTGRFASELKVGEGVDPSLPMLNIAAARGIRTYVGRGEQLPFKSESVDGLLLVLSLCFIADPAQALRECFRVLRPTGHLLLGVIPAESDWGKLYQMKKSQGHPLYSLATFRPAREIIALTETAGFTMQRAASTVFWPPAGPADVSARVEEGISPQAGFLGLRFARNLSKR